MYKENVQQQQEQLQIYIIKSEIKSLIAHHGNQNGVMIAKEIKQLLKVSEKAEDDGNLQKFYLDLFTILIQSILDIYIVLKQLQNKSDKFIYFIFNVDEVGQFYFTTYQKQSSLVLMDPKQINLIRSNIYKTSSVKFIKQVTFLKNEYPNSEITTEFSLKYVIDQKDYCIQQIKSKEDKENDKIKCIYNYNIIINMNFGFRFKQTKPIKFPKTENQLLIQIEQCRQKIYDSNWQDCNKGDINACLQLEKLLTQYILFLDQIIEQHVKIDISFQWNDSYEPNKFTQSNQWHYEYSCSMYNLGLLYYHLGQNLTILKDAINKNRNSQWCFQRLSEVIAFVNSKTVHQHSDLSYVHIHMHNCYAGAFGYKKLYEHFQNNKNTNEQLEVLGLLYEASKLYEQTIRCLTQTKQCHKKPIPPIIYDQLLVQFSSDHVLTLVITNLELAKFMSSTVKEVPNELRMGKALTYLNKAEQSISEYFKKFKQKNELLQLKLAQIQALKKEYLQVNENTFKHPLAKEYELLQLPVKQDLIKPKPPDVFNIENKQQQQQEQCIIDCQKLIQQINSSKNKAQQKLIDLQNNFNSIYSQYNIQFMIDSYQNAESLKLTPSIQQKVQFIKDRGGWNGCQNQIQKIHQLQQEQGKKLISIKNLLDLQSMQHGPPNQGHYLLSKQIENFRSNVEDIQKRLIEASLINRTTDEQIKGIKDQLLFIEQNSDQMLISRMQTSLQESQNFYRKNIQTLKKLSIIVESIMNKIDLIKIQLGNLEKYIDDLGLDQSSKKTINQNILLQAEKLIQVRMAEYDAIFNSINLKDLEKIASDLEDKQLFLVIANQGEQDFENQLKMIQDAFYNLEYAQQFYDSISFQVTQLANLINELTNNSN